MWLSLAVRTITFISQYVDYYSYAFKSSTRAVVNILIMPPAFIKPVHVCMCHWNFMWGTGEMKDCKENDFCCRKPWQIYCSLQPFPRSLISRLCQSLHSGKTCRRRLETGCLVTLKKKSGFQLGFATQAANKSWLKTAEPGQSSNLSKFEELNWSTAMIVDHNRNALFAQPGKLTTIGLISCNMASDSVLWFLLQEGTWLWRATSLSTCINAAAWKFRPQKEKERENDSRNESQEKMGPI